jgi:hypothetical protein
MRIAPYRIETLEIKGVIIIFINISDLKNTENALSLAKNNFLIVSQETENLVVQFASNGLVLDVNPAFEACFGPRETSCNTFLSFSDRVNRVVFEAHLAYQSALSGVGERFQTKHKCEGKGVIAVEWILKANRGDGDLASQILGVGRIIN